MTGIISSMADGLIIGNINLALASVGALICFIAGAALTELFVNWARGKRLQSEYALPLIVEAVLLLCFGILGAKLHRHMGLFVSITVMLLCFLMGLQNAIITRISSSVIRTTHMTGIVTDIGIELGKLFYWNRKIDREDKSYVKANRSKLMLFIALLFMFFFRRGCRGFRVQTDRLYRNYSAGCFSIDSGLYAVVDDLKRIFH